MRKTKSTMESTKFIMMSSTTKSLIPGLAFTAWTPTTSTSLRILDLPIAKRSLTSLKRTACLTPENRRWETGMVPLSLMMASKTHWAWGSWWLSLRSTAWAALVEATACLTESSSCLKTWNDTSRPCLIVISFMAVTCLARQHPRTGRVTLSWWTKRTTGPLTKAFRIVPSRTTASWILTTRTTGNRSQALVVVGPQQKVALSFKMGQSTHPLPMSMPESTLSTSREMVQSLNKLAGVSKQGWETCTPEESLLATRRSPNRRAKVNRTKALVTSILRAMRLVSNHLTRLNHRKRQSASDDNSEEGPPHACNLETRRTTTWLKLRRMKQQKLSLKRKSSHVQERPVTRARSCSRNMNWQLLKRGRSGKLGTERTAKTGALATTPRAAPPWTTELQASDLAQTTNFRLRSPSPKPTSHPWETE